jgi:hypothetical protein
LGAVIFGVLISKLIKYLYKRKEKKEWTSLEKSTKEKRKMFKR